MLKMFVCAAAQLVLSIGLAHAASETVIHNFEQFPDGEAPQAGLIQDKNGNLYGTTTDGGAYYFGDVYELSPNGSGGFTFNVLYSFEGSYDGVYPSAPLTMDAQGNLYGTAIFGGEFSRGTVFELSPSGNGTWTLSHYFDFKGDRDGGGPATAVTLDKTGHIFGTTSLYGAGGGGTVFEITPSPAGWAQKVIHEFKKVRDGAAPHGGLLMDASGDLYGTAPEGGRPNKHSGISGGGVVYRLHFDGTRWQESILHDFNHPAEGSTPAGDLTMDSAGNLYGTTTLSTYGTVFELSPPANGARDSAGWQLQTLYKFVGGKSGGNPNGGVSFDSSGALYGIATSGGDSQACQNGCGLVYKLSNKAGTWSQTVLHRFNVHDGETPLGDVLIGADGALYGTTYAGGSRGCGVVYSVVP
jgi:uncharacterized repeat protein (TIGR03803 family)